MSALSVEAIFEAAVQIQLCDEKNLALVFSESGISIRFPTTRRLAEYLDVPHYYVLPFFAIMEQDELVTRAERVGIHTTAKGTVKMLEIIAPRYRQEAESLLGTAILDEVIQKTHENR